MNLLVLRVNIPKVKNNLIIEEKTFINYTVFLTEARINTYNHSIYIPARTVVIEDLKELLTLDWDNKELNVSFIQEELLHEYQNLKIKGTLNLGLLTSHEVATELLNTTPIYYDKDSISDSLTLLDLSKTINAYGSVLSQNFSLEYLQTKKSLERIKPINSSLNFMSLKNGFAFSGPSVNEVKKTFRIKNAPDKAKYYFTKSGEPFYTLGSLGKLTNNLNSIWNR